MLKWLRALGPPGNLIANALVFLTTNWGFVVSVIVGLAVGAWGWAVEILDHPAVRVGGEVFLLILWSYIGLAVLRSLKTPKSVRVFHDYAYAIAFEACALMFDPTKLNEVAFNLNFRNVGPGPLKFRVEELRVILDGRTADHPDSVGKEVVMPRVAGKGYRTPSIPRDPTKQELRETADFTLLYGHPDTEFVRKFRMKLELAIRFENLPFNPLGPGPIFSSGIMIETDSPYHA